MNKDNVIPMKPKQTIKLDMPFNVIDVLGEVRREEYKYIIRDEIIEDTENRNNKQPIKMTNCYSLETGHWIGNLPEAFYLCETEKLTKLQKISEKSCVCTIGFSEEKQAWYGWSHRSVCHFSIGDMIFDENLEGATDETPFKEHGTTKIENLNQAKKAATAFANYIS